MNSKIAVIVLSLISANLVKAATLPAIPPLPNTFKLAPTKVIAPVSRAFYSPKDTTRNVQMRVKPKLLYVKKTKVVGFLPSAVEPRSPFVISIEDGATSRNILIQFTQYPDQPLPIYYTFDNINWQLFTTLDPVEYPYNVGVGVGFPNSAIPPVFSMK